MRIVLSLFLALHGAIHLLGVFRRVSVHVGLAWFLAVTLFLTAALLRFTRVELWWINAGIGVVVSQALIIATWHDAKIGTVANALILIAVVVAAASGRFKHGVDDRARALLYRAPSAPAEIVRSDDLDRLPPPVRRWLSASGVVGRARVRTVRLVQRGEMRTAPDKPWMPVEAEQYFTVDPPGFLWSVDATMIRVLPILGRDEYADGHGHMLIKLGGLVSVADATGPEIDQGTLLRFLGEIVWFPSAALAPYISWEGVDGQTAKATMRYGGTEASALFSFDEQGRCVRLTARRHMGSGKGSSLQEWVVPSTDWRVIRGVRIPVKGDAIWKLAGGDFDYYRWEIVDVEYDRPSLYDRRR